MKYLAISPHPDDIDYGCAGTMAKLAADGHHVEELILTDGSKGNKPGLDDIDKLVELRKKEQKESASILGVENVEFLGKKDGELTNTRELRKEIAAVVREKEPDIVFSFDPSNRDFENRFVAHRDHRQGGLAVFDAVSPAAKNEQFFPELLDRGLEPHKVDQFWFFATNKPNRIIDISDVMEQKIEALCCHRTQIQSEDWARERLSDLARRIAEKEEFEFGESFRILNLD